MKHAVPLALARLSPIRCRVFLRTIAPLLRRPLALGAVLLLAACEAAGAGRAARAADTDTLDIPAFDTITVAHVEDTTRVRAVPPVRSRELSPLADSLAEYMTFLAKFQRVFVGASRAKRLLVDIGRINAKVATPALHRAYEEAVAALSPIRIGDRFRLHGPWGADDAEVTGFGVWNGRMVATLAVPRVVDSLARRKAPLVVLAVRSDSAQPPVVDSCARDSVGATLAARIPLVRDSLVQLLQGDSAFFPPRLRAVRRTRTSYAVGCFGRGRVLLIANSSAGGYEVVREHAVLLDTAGTPTALRVGDLRFKAHEVLRVFDADGDGVDDIAVIGRAPRSGGTVVLRLDPPRLRLEYLMSGFAWETF